MRQLLLLSNLFVLFVTSPLASIDQREVLIYPQPDSPLQISKGVPKWRVSKDPQGQEINMLTLDLVYRNVSNKTIRAYTIRQFEGEFDKDLGMTTFGNAMSVEGLLEPKGLRSETLGERGSKKKTGLIKLAVDFVEFTDASTWGNDLSKSVEQLAGLRAGIKAGEEYLLKVKRANGIEAVIKVIDEVKDLLPPVDRSVAWKRGFRTGVGSVGHEIKDVYEKGGSKAAELKLQKQFFPAIFINNP